MENKMVVCDIYELFRRGKKFVNEENSRTIERTNAVVTREWAERHNDDWQNLGLWFEIDEEKTKEYYRKGKEKRARLAKAKQKKQQLTTVVSDILETANEKVEDIEVEVVEEVKVEKYVEVEDEFSGLGNGDLRVKYFDKFDKHVPPNMKNNNEWIIKKLKE